MEPTFTTLNVALVTDSKQLELARDRLNQKQNDLPRPEGMSYQVVYKVTSPYSRRMIPLGTKPSADNKVLRGTATSYGLTTDNNKNMGAKLNATLLSCDAFTRHVEVSDNVVRFKQPERAAVVDPTRHNPEMLVEYKAKDGTLEVFRMSAASFSMLTRQRPGQKTDTVSKLVHFPLPPLNADGKGQPTTPTTGIKTPAVVSPNLRAL